MKRCFLVSTVLLLAAPGFASFELLLVADNGNGTAGSARVHRIDGTTGAYFGSFGGGVLRSAAGITIDEATGRAYVHEPSSGAYLVFDYNVGTYFGRLDPGTFYDRYPVISNGFLFGTGLSLNKVNLTTGAQSTVALPDGGAPVWVAKENSTNLIIDSYINTATSHLFRYNTVSGLFTALGSGFADNSAFFADSQYFPSLGTVTNPLVIAGLGGGGDLRRYLLDAAGNYTSSGSVTSTFLNNCYGVTPSHSGFFTCGRLATDGTHGGVAGFDNFLTERETYSYSNMYDPRGMASVIAPEPGSALALLGGLALLVRRRR